MTGISFPEIAQSSVVLVVEDEPLLRLHAVDLLGDAGFHVIEAGDADEAIRILGERSDIRVVFSDIHMPGSMDGLKLAAAIRNRWPPIELVLTSGFFAQLEAIAVPEGVRFIPKPYNEQHLVETVAAMFGQHV